MPIIYKKCNDFQDRLLDVVVEGKLRSSLSVTDFVYSNIKCATFIEPEANHLATVSEDGSITIWSTRTGDLVWILSLHNDTYLKVYSNSDFLNFILVCKMETALPRVDCSKSSIDSLRGNWGFAWASRFP